MATRNGTPGNDTLTGTQFADSLFGFAGNDSLLGLSGNDSLNGGGGNDTLDGGNGIDILNGGVGNDTYIVDSTTDTITETANSGIDIVQSSVSYTLGSSLDNLTLTGTSAINGTGNSLNNTITGNDANNTLNGGAGNDILSGGSSGYGEFSGNDILYGGDGNDILFASNSYDRGSYSYTGEDILHGGNGNDTLNGGLANNTLDGGVGNDTYIIVNNIGVITESASSGIDVVESDGSYTLGSNLENLTLTGSFNSNGTGNSLNNTLIGNAASNFLNGLAGDDKLIGGAGNDILLGSSGTIGEKDTLTGGAGIDRFILGTVTQDFYDDRNKATAGTGDYALITDFNTNQDSIKLNGRRTDYLLAVSPTGLPAGIAIYRNKPAGERDELIAIVQGSSGLDLNGQYFQFTANEINLSTLNGSNGFVLKGIDANGQLGHSVSSAGDINGDGFDDVIIGAPYAEKSYVVFGKAGSFGTSINVSDLNGSNGFVINGAGGSFDLSGNSVSSAGDINGDGFSDLLLRARFADSYVVFGQGGNFSPSVNLSTLNGSNGFVISGIGFTGFAPKSVSSAGDINGDGFDDFLIGTNQGDPNGQSDAGKSYVVFGKIGGFSAAINVSELNGSNGFVINGIDEYDQSSWSVSSAGDINGDGFDDIIIGANGADSNGQERAGESYVVFGKAGGFSASLKLSDLNGSNGFVINGINAGDDSGFSVSSAGDVNGDGLDDIIIGARGAASNGEYGTGESYMVFGKVGSFGSSFNPSTLNGNNGFVINSIDNGDGIGFSVSSAGDINSDGLDDIIIGAPRSADNGQDGESYVVFGKEGGFGASINLSTLNGSNGFAINSINASINGDLAGWSVSSAGDVNGDGFDDLMVGAIQAGVGNAGESYVIFGRDFTNSVTQTGTEGNDTLSGTAGDDILVGGRGNDRLIGGMGVDVLYGGAGDDILSFGAIDRRLNGGSGTDTLRIDTSGITLDLRAIANNKITEFELIDLTGTGNNSLKFTRLDLLALSDTTNQLIINGNAGDTATSTGQGWTPGGTTTLNRILYDRYTIGAATLLVDADITQTIT